MSGVMAAWIVGAVMLTWTQGLGRQGGPTWPPPFIYIDLTVLMGICALIARANNTVGGLLAWGFLIALFIRGELAQGGPQPSIAGQLAQMITALGGQGSAAATWAGQAPGGGATPGTGITGAGGVGTPSQRSAGGPPYTAGP